MGLSPARGCDGVLDHRRPDRSGEIVAGGRDPNRDAAMRREPERDIGHERPEGRGAADADEQVTQREGPQGGRIRGGKKAERERTDPQQGGGQYAEPVLQPPHGDAAARKAEQGERKWQRGIGPQHAELRLHRGHNHGHRPQPDAANRAERHRCGEAHPRIGRINVGVPGGNTARIGQ